MIQIAEYHVGCGAFDNRIYAGTTTKDRFTGEQRFKAKSDVTDEAERAVAEYFKNIIDDRELGSIVAKYRFKDGTVLKMIIEEVDE